MLLSAVSPPKLQGALPTLRSGAWPDSLLGVVLMLQLFCPFDCSRFRLVASLFPESYPFLGELSLTMFSSLRVLEGKAFGLRCTRTGRMEEEERREPGSGPSTGLRPCIAALSFAL